MGDLYFTADLHFGHKWMAEHRGYTADPTREERAAAMDVTIIKDWQTLITAKDTIYILGDFSFANRETTEWIFHELPGHKHLIVGNHDPKHVTQLPWESVSDLKKVKHNGQSIWCCHYPLLTWANAHHGTWHVHGHSHGNLRTTPSSRMDVGIDATGKIAVSVEEVGEWMADHPYDYVDHHNEDE